MAPHPNFPRRLGEGKFALCVASRESCERVNEGRRCGTRKGEAGTRKMTLPLFRVPVSPFRVGSAPPTRKMLAHLHFTDHDYPTTSNLPPPPAISLCLQPSGVALRHQEPPPVAGERARQEQTNVDIDKQPANLQELAGCFDNLNAHFGALVALSGCRKPIRTGDALRYASASV